MSRWVDLDEQVYCGEYGEYTNYNINMETVINAPTIEPSGDLISRADAIQCKPEFLNPICNWNEGWNKAIHEWYEALKTVPSVSAISQTDSLIIADALRYLAEDEERHEKDRERAKELREKVLAHGASLSAEPKREKVNMEGKK